MLVRKTACYVAVVVLAGVALSSGVYNFSKKSEKDEAFLSFQAGVQGRIGLVKEMLDGEEVALAALGALYETMPSFGKQEFSATTAKVMRVQSSIRYVGWAPLITDEQRSAAEALWRKEAGGNLFFHERIEGDGVRSVAERPLHFPLYYSEPQEGGERYLGWDFLSEANYAAPIKKVLKERRVSATSRMDFFEGAAVKSAVLVFYPVFGATPSEKPRGLLVGVIFIDQAIEETFSHIADHEKFRVVVDDITSGSAERLYTDPALMFDPGKAAFKVSETIDTMGRKWDVTVYAAPDAFLPDDFPPTMVLASGFMLTLLLSVLAFFTANRQALMEKTVQEKTLALQESMTLLEKARDEAVAAAKVKSEFLANMSHEIRTPLNGILAATELLADTGMNGSQRNYVDVIRASGDILLSTINDILDLSKLEAGKVMLEPMVVEVLHASQVLASIFFAQANAKNLQFSCVLSTEKPLYVLADHLHLRQVIVNLVGNAIKYTPAGRVEVKVNYFNREGRDYMRFEVADTGVGVPVEMQEAIFEKFTQLNRNEARKGTGLGLSICKSLIELMQGQIGVVSDGVNGSVFWFEVPVVIVEDPKAFEKESLTEEWKSSNHVGCKVLLVEDVETNRLVAREMLRKLGCEIDMAVNGQLAIEALAQKTYDIVFMDCQMPVMNGFEATRTLRQRGDKTVVVALTAHAFAEEVQKCLAVGMNDFISKPISSVLLKSILDKWHKGKAEGVLAVAPQVAQKASQVEAVLPVLDLSLLRDVFVAIPEKAPRIVELAQKDCDRLLDEIKAAMVVADLSEAKECAHALKSAAQQIGGYELAQACSRMEQACKKKDPDEARAAFIEISEAHPRFVSAVREQVVILGATGIQV